MWVRARRRCVKRICIELYGAGQSASRGWSTRLCRSGWFAVAAVGAKGGSERAAFEGWAIGYLGNPRFTEACERGKTIPSC